MSHQQHIYVLGDDDDDDDDDDDGDDDDDDWASSAAHVSSHSSVNTNRDFRTLHFEQNLESDFLKSGHFLSTLHFQFERGDFRARLTKKYQHIFKHFSVKNCSLIFYGFLMIMSYWVLFRVSAALNFFSPGHWFTLLESVVLNYLVLMLKLLKNC